MLSRNPVDIEAGVEIPGPRRPAATATPNSPGVPAIFHAAAFVVGVRTLASEAALGGVGLVDVKHAKVVGRGDGWRSKGPARARSDCWLRRRQMLSRLLHGGRRRG